MDFIDSVIATANHSPEICDQSMIVGAIECVLAVIKEKKASTQYQEHVMAEGLMRSALKYERQLLQEMERRNVLVGKDLLEGGQRV